MAVTLAQAQKLTKDKLYAKVIDEFRKDGLLDLMLFDDCVSLNGGSTLNYVYQRIKTLPQAGFRAINSEYESQEVDTQDYTAKLKVFGGKFSIDRVIQDNVKGITDQLTLQLKQKIQATKALFSDTFINGDSATNALAFDGLDKAVTGSTTELTPNTIIDLSTTSALDSNYRAFLDLLRKVKARMDADADVMLVNREMFAIFQSICDRASSFQQTKNELGTEVVKWGNTTIVKLGDKPGTSNPIIATDNSGLTSVYFARIAEDGVHAVTPQGSNIIKTYLPNFKEPGAVKDGEVEMVACMALKATRAAGVLRNIRIAPVVSG